MTPKERNLAEMDAIAELYGYTVEDILGKSKVGPLMKVRRMCVLRMRNKGYSTLAIGRIMNRDHSTIVHSLQKIRAEMEAINDSIEA
jgi:chromosomal replication initiation ATPase DnaA